MVRQSIRRKGFLSYTVEEDIPLVTIVKLKQNVIAKPEMTVPLKVEAEVRDYFKSVAGRK